jgi:hypothetical protein
MSRLRRRAAIGLPGALVAAALLAAPGCSMFSGLGAVLGEPVDNPEWLTARFKGVSSTDVLRLAQTAVEHDYPPKRLDAYRGEFETGWIYGLFDDVRRNPLRQRIVVHAAAEEGVLVVQLRAQQECNDSAGRLAGPNDTGWQAAQDDPVRARIMMQKLLILLQDIAERVPDPKSDDQKT